MLVEAVILLVYPVRVPLEALRLLSESVCRGPCDVNKIETKALKPNIEAKDRSKTKTF